MQSTKSNVNLKALGYLHFHSYLLQGAPGAEGAPGRDGAVGSKVCSFPPFQASKY